MNKQRIMDMHVHSDNSPDGHHSPMYICESAVDKGLRAIAFTDHCEVDKFFSQKYILQRELTEQTVSVIL